MHSSDSSLSATPDLEGAVQRVLTIREAAHLLKVHPNTLRNLLAEGSIPAARIGRQWRFLEGELVAWIRSGYSAPARMQSSAPTKEALWHSGNVQENTTSSSQHLTERSLDALLERPTG
ncbi:helix-turn-helix domain-containing protein [Sphingobium sp. CR28]|uniref:helix-turn-helix domain-containing protein n=1 Tax=Sphingobium sp. CR28 TaxID=3400272 RepID=UPI003FF0B705